MTATDGGGSMQKRCFVNLQRPYCKLTCEFYKNMIFVKRRCFFIKLPSVAVLYELDVQYRHGWR